jgi:K+ transporter
MTLLALAALGVVFGGIGTSPLYALQTVCFGGPPTVKLRGSRLKPLLIALGMFGVALFYGDGMITPAISVLSAVEGVKVAVPSLGSLVEPITIAVLVALFAIQRFACRSTSTPRDVGGRSWPSSMKGRDRPTL